MNETSPNIRSNSSPGHYNFSQHDLKIIIYTDECTFFVLVVPQGNGDH